MKNRTVIGIVCIILAVAVTFVVSPLVNNISDKKTEVIRFVTDVSHGTEIKDTDVELVKISNSALP
jgi:pilus assembly protein CpaB